MLVRRLFVVGGLLLVTLGPPGSPAYAAGPVITGLSGPASVARYAKFETSAAITPTPANPYDPAQLNLEGHFTAPSGGQVTVPGFAYQGYTRTQDANGNEVLTASGALSWKVRFAPTEVGTWQWSWTVTTPTGSTSSSVQTLQVTGGPSHGFLQVSPTSNRYLSYTDGSPYFAVGENTAFPDGTEAGPRTYAYDSLFSSLAAQGGNWARVWMAPFGGAFPNGFGVEWSNTGLGNYGGRQDHAWDLDYVVDLAGSRGVALQLALQWHGAWSTTVNSDWVNNPYNAANGGPLASPGAVFTDATALSYERQLLRYMVARWGYATSVGTWELWNEVGYVDNYAPSVSQSWHASMAAYLRSLDPAHRPLTTSLGNNAQDPQLWANAGLDVSQIHRYNSATRCNSCNWPLDLRTAVLAARTNDAVPTLVGEESISTTGGSAMFQNDPLGVGFHDALWSPLMSGAYGTGMSWWWLAVDNHASTYYPLLGAISRFLAPVRLDQESLVSDIRTQTPIGATLDVYGLHGNQVALYWVKDRAYQWGSVASAPINAGKVTLPTSATGYWCGTWWDTWSGTATTGVPSTPSGTVLAAPLFRGDTALRLTAC